MLLILSKPAQDAGLTKDIKESGEEQLEEISNFLKDVPNMKWVRETIPTLMKPQQDVGLLKLTLHKDVPKEVSLLLIEPTLRKMPMDAGLFQDAQ